MNHGYKAADTAQTYLLSLQGLKFLKTHHSFRLSYPSDLRYK